MGRMRKPLEEQTGDLTVERQQQREFEQQLAQGDSLPDDPPETLVNDEAVKLWEWAVGEMKKMPLLCSVDTLNLEGMCNAFALYRGATADLKGKPLADENGINPLINVQKKYAEEYRAFARLCGFTVDSRLKLAAVSAKNTDDDISEEFGEI